MYPDNSNPLPSELPPLRFSKLRGNIMEYRFDTNEYFKNFHSISVIKRGVTNDYEIEKYIVTSSFIATKEMSEMKMVFILHDQSGLKKQFVIKTPFIIKKALFSNILMDLQDKENSITYKLLPDTPNKKIEKQYINEKNKKKWNFDDPDESK